jgi:chromate transporter
MRPSDDRFEPRETGIAAVSLPSLLGSFLKIGSIGFGGGMAVIALMEEEFVRKRRIIPLNEFIGGVGLGQLLGAFAVNTAIFVGYRFFGIVGGLLSAAAFMAPSFLLVVFLSDLYFRYHAIPALQSTIQGVGPVVIALIVNAAWSIGRRVANSWAARAIAIGALVAGLFQVNAALVLVAAGAAGFLLRLTATAAKQPDPAGARPRAAEAKSLLITLPVLTGLPLLFTTFFQIGMIFFGGGFILIPVLHNRLVSQLGWLKPQEFLDGLAISNLAPGPIALIATFAGYRVGGPPGALLATVALFGPGILLMLAISHEYQRFRGDERTQRILAGINPAMAGLILSAAPLLGRSALVSSRGYALFALSLALLAGFRWHPAFVLIIGAASGYFGLLP